MSWPADGQPRFKASGGIVMDRAYCHWRVADFEPSSADDGGNGGRREANAQEMAQAVADWLERDGENALTLALRPTLRRAALEAIRGDGALTQAERRESMRLNGIATGAKRRAKRAE